MRVNTKQLGFFNFLGICMVLFIIASFNQINDSLIVHPPRKKCNCKNVHKSYNKLSKEFLKGGIFIAKSVKIKRTKTHSEVWPNMEVYLLQQFTKHLPQGNEIKGFIIQLVDLNVWADFINNNCATKYKVLHVPY